MANPQTPQQPAAPQKREWEIAWEQTQKSPEYQNADNDMEREAMRLEVFRDYVAPNLSTYEIEAGLQEFNRRTAPKGDPTSGIAGDTAAAIKSGLWNVGGDIASAFTLGDPNAVSLGMKARSEEAWNQASPSAIAEAAAFGVDYKEGTGLGGFSFKPGSTGYGAYLNTVKGATSMVPMMAGGGVFGMGAKGIARVAGVTKKTKDAIAAGNKAKALAAMKQAETITKATQFTGQSALMGGMIGGGTADQAFNEVYNQPEQVLEQSEIYRGYLDQGMSREQARDTLARDAAKSAFNGGFALGTASGGLYGRFLDKMLKGGLGATTRMGNAGRGFAGEALQETVESGGQQYLSNVAQGDVGLPVDPMKDVYAQAATGTLLGGLMGGPIGGLSKGRKAPDLDNITQNLNAAETNASNLENELATDLDPETRVNKEAELEKTYRAIMDYRAIREDLKKNPPKAKKEKTAESQKTAATAKQQPVAKAAAQPAATKAPAATTEQQAEPLESEASWVDVDLDQQIIDMEKDIRQSESNLRRTLQNGGTIEDNRILERDLKQKQALLDRLLFMSENRGEQNYFDNREDFYRWVDQSIGTTKEQAAARRELTHRKIRQQPGGNYPTVVPGQQPQKTFMEEQPPELRAGMEGVLRDEAYQEAVQAIPSQEDIDYDTEQLNRRERGERIIGNAKQLLGAHRRQKQFEQLKAEHEQQTRPQPPVAQQAQGTPAEKTPRQEKTETDERAVPAAGRTAGKHGPFEPTKERQRARIKDLRERLEVTSTPGNKHAANQLRLVSAAMATHGNQTVTIDGKTLTVTRGKVDKDEFNRFTQSLARRVPKTEQRRKNLATAAARLISQIGDRYATLDDPLSKELARKARRVAKALTTQNDLTLHYGSDQLLKIEDGQVPARELKAFRQWLEGPENTNAGYWKNTLTDIQKSLKGQPRSDKVISVEKLLATIDRKQTQTIGYNYPDTRHVNVIGGDPDHQQMTEFIGWIKPNLKPLSPAPQQTSTARPVTTMADRLLKEAATRQRINKENAERRQQRAEETARELEKDKPRQQREAEREKSHRSAQEQRKLREEQQRREGQKPKLPAVEPEATAEPESKEFSSLGELTKSASENPIASDSYHTEYKIPDGNFYVEVPSSQPGGRIVGKLTGIQKDRESKRFGYGVILPDGSRENFFHFDEPRLSTAANFNRYGEIQERQNQLEQQRKERVAAEKKAKEDREQEEKEWLEENERLVEQYASHQGINLERTGIASFKAFNENKGTNKLKIGNDVIYIDPREHHDSLWHITFKLQDVNKHEIIPISPTTTKSYATFTEAKENMLQDYKDAIADMMRRFPDEFSEKPAAEQKATEESATSTDNLRSLFRERLRQIEEYDEDSGEIPPAGYPVVGWDHKETKKLDAMLDQAFKDPENKPGEAVSIPDEVMSVVMARVALKLPDPVKVPKKLGVFQKAIFSKIRDGDFSLEVVYGDVYGSDIYLTINSLGNQYQLKTSFSKASWGNPFIQPKLVDAERKVVSEPESMATALREITRRFWDEQTEKAPPEEGKFEKVKTGSYELKTPNHTATVTSVKSMGGEGDQWSVTISDNQGRELYNDTADSFTKGKHLVRAYLEENPSAPNVSEKPENVNTSEERVQETAESEQVDPFRKALDELYESTDSNYLKGRIDSVINLMQQLKDSGTDFVDPKQFMDEIDSGNRAGFSREEQRKDLAGYKADLIGLDNGTVKPRKIGGTGATKANAKAWLKQRISDLELSLAHDGMMHHTNISNYAGTLKDIRNGKDEGFKSDEQLKQEREAREQEERERDQEAEQLKAIAEQTYETGDHESMNQPFWVSFNVDRNDYRLLAKLAEAKTPEEKYQILIKDTGAKKQDLSFRDKVDLNNARKKNAEFGYFSVEKRRGYRLIKMAIDLKASNTQQKPQAAPEKASASPLDDTPAPEIKKEETTVKSFYSFVMQRDEQRNAAREKRLATAKQELEQLSDDVVDRIYKELEQENLVTKQDDPDYPYLWVSGSKRWQFPTKKTLVKKVLTGRVKRLKNPIVTTNYGKGLKKEYMESLKPVMASDQPLPARTLYEAFSLLPDVDLLADIKRRMLDDPFLIDQEYSRMLDSAPKAKQLFETIKAEVREEIAQKGYQQLMQKDIDRVLARNNASGVVEDANVLMSGTPTSEQKDTFLNHFYSAMNNIKEDAGRDSYSGKLNHDKLRYYRDALFNKLPDEIQNALKQSTIESLEQRKPDSVLLEKLKTGTEDVTVSDIISEMNWGIAREAFKQAETALGKMKTAAAGFKQLDHTSSSPLDDITPPPANKLKDLNPETAAEVAAERERMEQEASARPHLANNNGEANAAELDKNDPDQKNVSYAYKRILSRGAITANQAREMQRHFSGEEGMQALEAIARDNPGASVADLMSVIIKQGTGRDKGLHVTDSGQIEEIDGEVIRDALDDAKSSPKFRDITEARKWLLGEIDKAIKAAPKEAEPNDFVRFSVPGDGTFRVKNSKDRLKWFKGQVEENSGFKKPPKTKTGGSRLARGSKYETALYEFLKDGEYENAYWYAKNQGKSLIYQKTNNEAGVIADSPIEEITLHGERFVIVKTDRGDFNLVYPKLSLSGGSGKTRKELDKQIKNIQGFDKEAFLNKLKNPKHEGMSQEQAEEQFKKYYKIDEYAEETEPTTPTIGLTTDTWEGIKVMTHPESDLVAFASRTKDPRYNYRVYDKNRSKAEQKNPKVTSLSEAQELIRNNVRERRELSRSYQAEPDVNDTDVVETAPTPEPTARQQRAGKRQRRMVEIDAELDELGAEMAAIFKEAGRRMGAGLDPIIAGKLMITGVRAGAKMVEKGAIRFADWADSMLGLFERHGVSDRDAAPYLKRLYLATGAEVSDTLADQMDDQKTVRAFDLDSLLEPETESESTEQESTGEPHVSITGSNLERDSRGSGTETQVGQENIPHDSGRTGSTDARTGREDDEGRGREQRDTGLSEDSATAGGTRSDTDLLEDHGSYGDEGRPADSGERSGSRDTGREGTHAERRADQQVENAAAATGKLTLEQKVELQEKADAIPTKHGDLQNIRDTLPVLLPEQQEDVLKGETRLYTNGEAGMLFTNGTGTGKTFTGLGHIKRLARDGKDNTLIMAPSDKVANDWIQSGKLLGLNITQLKNTRDAGSGIVVTTYENAGINDSLVHRNWDMVVADESHKLMQNAEGDETLSLKTLRAITLNPRGAHSRHAMLMADEIAQYQELGQSIDNLTKMANLDDTMDQARDAYLKEAEQKTKQRTALGKKLDAHLEKVRSEVDAVNKKDRTKVLFLSATPFAYHKNIPYADGYLFDIYGSEPDRHTGYNEPGSFERFFVENFGYRMSYNKLTAPDKDVDVGLMEREFNQKLKDSGALSGRRLEVDADYSRQFVLVEDAIGQKIDEGIELIRTDKRLSKLQSLLDGKFDYLKQVQMLEAIKANHAVERIRQHQAMGRKVVVFHNFKVGGTQNPFLFRKGTDRDVNDAIDLFNDLRPDLAKLEMNLPSPIITLQLAFPDLLLFNGDIKPQDRRANADAFNDDNNQNAVILVQRAAGKEGVSLHDTTGKHQRVLMDLGLPGAPTDLIQTEGRIYRVGQKSNAIDEYLVTGTNFEKYAFASKVASRSSTAENLALGHEGRQLQPAIIEAFKDMSDAAPSEQQGSGGKTFDRQNSEVSYYDRAKTYYFARMKRTSKTKSAEGTDYFATPEPAGLKMTEMANIKRGESMLEPSSGHGAIARWFPEFTRNTFVEPSYKLAAELGLNTNGKILNHDFEDLALINKFDGIVMNPPFGVGGKTAAEHVEKAMKHTRDGGRIVALIPVGPAADKRFAKLEESDTAKDFYKVAEILLPSVTFKRAGTSVMGKIVVWEKQEGENNPSQLQFKRRDYTDITDIKELFDRLEDFTLPDRLPPEPKKTKAVEGEITLTNEMGNETTFSVMDSQHTKTGAPLYVVNMEGSLLDEQYKAISKLARDNNGFYIKAKLRNFYKPPFGFTPKGKPTFTFKNVEDRNDFLTGLQEITTTEAETDSRYRLAEPGVKGIKPYQAKTLQTQLNRALGKLVTVVQSEANLPKHLRDQIRAEGVTGQVKGIYDEQSGQTFVIADRSENISDAIKTALHEAVGHKGLRNVLGGALNNTLANVYRSLGKTQQQALRKAYSAQLAGKSELEQQQIIAEEYLAHLAETNPDHGWIRTTLARLRSWLRNHLPQLKWSQNDMRQLIMDARQSALTSTPAINTRNGTIKQKHTPRSGPRAVRYQMASMEKLSQAEMKKQALSAVTEAKEFSRNNLLGFFGGKQLAEMYGPIFDKVSDTIGHNPLKQLDKLLQKMTSERSNYANQAEKIDQSWSKLAREAPAVYNLLSNVMHKSTLWQQDPRAPFKLAGNKSIATLQQILKKPASEKQRITFQRQLDKELERKKQYDQLKKDWDALSPAAQAIYTRVENFYRKQWKDTKKALIEKVSGTQLDPHAKRSARSEIELMFHKALNGPYFPLMRFGDYVITATTAEGEHYRAHYETLTAMKAARADLEKQGYKIRFTGKRQDFNPRDMAGVGKFSAAISKILNSEISDNVPPEEKAAILSEINQITLELMPEMSSAKRSLHRKNVPGYHENARRAFDATSLTQANRISRIRYGWQMESEIDKMRSVATEDESSSPLTTDERIKATQVANEMSKRHDEIMNPKGNAISAALTNFGFFMYMGGSIGAGLVNMTQNLLIGLPQMASQYGFRNTARVMAQVTKDYFGKGGKMPKDLDGLLQNSWFSLEHAKGIPADEKALIRTLVKDGTIETTQAHVLAQMADMDIKPEDVKKKDWYVKLTRASGMFFHNAEVANRQIAALTAYRLAKANPKHGKVTLDANGHPDEASVDKIRKAVFDAHYDYSSTNRPRYFRSNWAKVFLLFKQYSQNTLFFLGRNFHQALKGESPEIKRQARKTLGTTFAMHGVFAGALGLPTASVWLGLAGLFMGDEDDPVDPEIALRNGLTSLFGKEVSHAMSKGLFNALMGIDIHSRTTANDLIFRGSDYEMSPRQEAQNFIISAMGGPLASMATNLYASAHRFAAGEQWEGLEGLLPKFVRDGMRAARYSTQGVQNSQGKTLLEDFSPWETGWKLAGISSARESEVYDLNKAVTGARKAIERRRSLLMESYFRADSNKERQQIQQQIYAFNDAQKARQRDWAVISPKQLRASVKSRQRTKDEAKHGIYLREAQLGMMDWGKFADI